MTAISPSSNLDQLFAAVPLITGLAQASASSVAAVTAVAATGEDAVSLSDRALQELQADVHRLGKVPVARSSGSEQQDLQNALGSYKIAQKNIDATAFKPEYQAFVDVINDATATDDQKLQAYMGFKADQAVEHGQKHFFGVDAVDFKFDWLTRNSDFLVRARDDGQAATAFNAAETTESKRMGQSIDLGKHSAGYLDVLASYNPLQQAVASVDLMSDTVSSMLRNWRIDKPSSKALQEQAESAKFPVDFKTAIAGAVATALKALQQSRAGSSSDPGSVAFRQQFTNLAVSFGQIALKQKTLVSISA